MKVLDERTFAPFSYRRADLIREVEWLNGLEVARWLTAQTDDLLDDVMVDMADLMCEGEMFTDALRGAVQSAHAAADAPARRAGQTSGVASDRAARCEEKA